MAPTRPMYGAQCHIFATSLAPDDECLSPEEAWLTPVPYFEATICYGTWQSYMGQASSEVLALAWAYALVVAKA